MSQLLLASLFEKSERRPLTVAQLTAAIRGELERRFANVWVEGEISNFRAHNSGHWYFTLKDEFAQVRVACYRSSNQRIRFRPQDGMQIRARGRLSVYEPKGEYQFIVETFEPVGTGALQLAFEQTRDRLKAEGLFAPELKRQIPYFPRRIGIVTSANGAAIRDILNVISRRTRTVHVLFAPARVQGEGAAHDVVRAIKFLNGYHAHMLRTGREEAAIDVMIVGRGGGSIEDLWAFNEEVVARAIRASEIPVISAVGHETDITISDFAADLRAPTPSAAAELVAAHEEELCLTLDRMVANLRRSIRFRIASERSRIQQLALSRGFEEVQARLRHSAAVAEDNRHRLFAAVNRTLQQLQRRMDVATLTTAGLRARAGQTRARFEALCKARDNALAVRMESARRTLSLAAASLDAMSPLKVMERGYAIAQNEGGQVVRDAETVSPGDALRLRLWKGSLACRVEGKTQVNE